MEKFKKRDIKLITYPSKILRTNCRNVTDNEFGSPEIKALCEIMGKMTKKYDGIGIAAPQLGFDINAIFISLNKKEQFYLLNPVVTSFGETKILDNEGCLSLPDIHGNVIRPQEVTIEAYDPLGKKIIITRDDLVSRIIQHEIDHLNGILFIDKTVNITDGQDLLDELQAKAKIHEL